MEQQLPHGSHGYVPSQTEVPELEAEAQAGRMASSWESKIPHSSKPSSPTVAATFPAEYDRSQA